MTNRPIKNNIDAVTRFHVFMHESELHAERLEQLKREELPTPFLQTEQMWVTFFHDRAMEIAEENA